MHKQEIIFPLSLGGNMCLTLEIINPSGNNV